MRTAVPALVVFAVAVSASASTATLAHSQLPSIVKAARFVTLQKWDGRVDELLASYGQSHQAPPAWKAGDPHWEQAKAKLLARFGAAIDELASAPDAETLVMKGFATMSDAEADAAASRLTPEILNYSDHLIIAVEAMTNKNTTNSLDPVVQETRKKWGTPPPARDSAVYEAVKEKSIAKLINARASAVRFLATGLDGQLQLFVFDRQEAIGREIGAAIAACAKDKRK